ncbi:MAG TPA: sugar kinase [Kribbellaceae bacterium]|nr:sugar kinase [Kribbellaceae bacterium]
MPSSVCVGEGMVVLTPQTSAPLQDVELFRRSVGGAECNVAGGLAALGVRSAWLSRLGADPFGAEVRRVLEARGVDTGAVELDPGRPTGLYVKDTEAGRMHYYRTGSAASALGPAYLDRPEVVRRLASADLVHTTGITPALSASTAALLERLAAERRCPLSVDLNWRPALWRDRDTAPLYALLRAADVVFLGADEAEAFAGTADPAALRANLLKPSATLVLKAGAGAVLAIPPGEAPVEVPALTVDVVEPVGAGDAFAAGYLAATLHGLPVPRRLRLGHLCAASVLAVPDDHAAPPPREVRDALLSCSEREWSGVRVGPDGIAAPVR